MNIALVLHPFREEAARIAAEFTAAATGRGHQVEVGAADAGRVPDAVARGEGAPEGVDLVVAVGGDGTVLEAVRQGIAADAPVLGVNAGHMGFLTEIGPTNVEKALDAIAAGDYVLSDRMTLTAHLPDGRSVLGINDAVIEKAISQHIVRVAAWVGDERLVGYRADGVVISTPTGSTAYNFSAGGPLIDPELDALVVTPIAPHTLFGRPLVFAPEARLRFEIEGDRPARVNVDGRSQCDLVPGDSIEVVRGEHRVRFLRLGPRNFTASVRQKFHLHDA